MLKFLQKKRTEWQLTVVLHLFVFVKSVYGLMYLGVFRYL